MTRLRGRAPRGARLHASAPCRRWESTTMISSVRLDGTTACMTVAGAANTGVFPAYSPDINPIEMMWSKVKAILRSLEARDNESLLAAIGTLLSMVTATDVMGWFSHCGYNFILNALNTSSIGTKQAIGKHP